MKSILLCSEEFDFSRVLAREFPLAIVSVLGKPLIAYWIEHLAAMGAKEVSVLAWDRPEAIRKVVGDGSEWGLKLEVVPLRNPLSRQEAQQLYPINHEAFLPQPWNLIEMNGLPNNPGVNIFETFQSYFEAVRSWMPHALVNRVGMKELSPGVWISGRSHVAPGAVLQAPCWIAENVYVEAGAVVGPMTVVESHVVIARNAVVSNSIIQQNTCIGEMTNVTDSIASGSTLVNWKNDSWVDVPDSFLLGPAGRLPRKGASNIVGRCAAVAVGLLTSPLILWPIVQARISGEKGFRKNIAKHGSSYVGYFQLNGAQGYLARWPELLNIVRGEFSWFGNRPLAAQEELKLQSEYERLWLQSPIGLFSQADAAGCWDTGSDEAKAHAAFYSACKGVKTNAKILFKVLSNWRRAASGVKTPVETSPLKPKCFSFRQAVSDFLSL